MTDDPDNDDDLIEGHGIVLRARNGDVIRYDPSGLVMRLSDKVVEDIALRLPGADRPAAHPSSPGHAPADAPDGIDAWDARQDGDWLRFTARLPGKQGVRGFRRHVDGGDIIAEPGGALLGLLGIGGARAALASPGGSTFPQHILAPADDIGAVGHNGIEVAQDRDRLEHLREMTHEALAAETILDWRMDDHGPLPVFVTRVETDASATAADLAKGRALQNLLIAARNLKAAADAMGQKAKVLAVTLDFALEDHSDSAIAYRDGMLSVMEAISDGLWKMGFDRPLFVARFEPGLPNIAPQAALEGQWELSWNHGDHRLIHSAPAYMFALDAYDRPTEMARRQQAEMTACAIAEAATWKCPTLHLAELEGEVLRVAARATGPLLIDPDDPLQAGPGAGFALLGCTNDATIKQVEIASDDPQTILLQLSKSPKGSDLRLAYACAGQFAGALRDGWHLDSVTGARLHRWALPANLPITHGRADA
ncbi:hypothetical protein [Hasllibacter sp. MH4015]|uniref:hypothetical protein n=1 Tax=Hasllibacter sp. MH4015 TaxID=2854029 RepID=UPI001CD2196C|nr:hypothetical protein [Hasllibacter sp. MH4015]